MLPIGPYRYGNPAAMGAAGFVGPLDAYASGLAGAWSLNRRLLSSYLGSAFRVRRSNDNAEADVPFLGSGMTNESFLASFVGSNSGYVTVVYDGSGLGRDMVQLTAAKQMQIVNAGTIERDGGGNMAMKVVTTNAQLYSTAAFTAYTGVALTGFAKGQIVGGSYERILSAVKDAQHDYDFSTDAAVITQAAAASALGAYRTAGLASMPITLGSPFSAIAVFNGVSYTISKTGASSTAASVGAFDINKFIWAAETSSNGNNVAGSKHLEIIAWATDQTANATAILAALS